jgi:hypothetical protein
MRLKYGRKIALARTMAGMMKRPTYFGARARAAWI